jgi:sulfate adenylyltransferase large subunit
MSQERLKITFVGHVDHGKSTLIGRLLYDTGSVPPDRMAAIEAASEEQGRDVEFAFLMDHLQEEREQGITIDTAQIWFKTDDRDYVIIDAPGHREFLKNMLTGAAQAEAALLLVDAEEGLGEQTQRHAFLLTLLGIRQCVVIMNKMDLVDFSEERFEALCGQLMTFLDRIGVEPMEFIPISARHGDNVVHPSDRMDWYDGLTVLEVLDSIPGMVETELPPRFCVQDIYDFDGKRLVAGRVESGTVDQGDALTVLPEGLETEVASVERFASERDVAEAGECVALTLPEDVPVRRGQVLCDPAALPQVTTTLTARVFWMAKEPLERDGEFDLKIVTQDRRCRVASILRRVNSSTLESIEEDAARLETTEVGDLVLEADGPVVAELIEQNPSLGRVVLETRGAVVGAGIITGLDHETPDGGVTA